MPTINQLSKHKSKRRKKQSRIHTPALVGAPLRRGVVVRVFVASPKKPNSANRKVARVKLGKLFNIRYVTAQIVGRGHSLQQHSVVYVRAGRARDLQGVRYRLIRGAKDFLPVEGRKTSRSKYGVRKSY